jgi:hypothetical protein
VGPNAGLRTWRRAIREIYKERTAGREELNEKRAWESSIGLNI